ncbi:hypothetical protein DFH28DRAFT_972245 [Melampsora americana]|nr:hypothetical protein DFH28DRAFT_972245 [Melampsora americana]
MHLFTLSLYTLLASATRTSCSPMEDVSRFNIIHPHSELIEDSDVYKIHHCGHQGCRATDQQGCQLVPLDLLSNPSGTYDMKTQENIPSRTMLPFDLNFSPNSDIGSFVFESSTQDNVRLKSPMDNARSHRLVRDLNLNLAPDSILQPDVKLLSSTNDDGSHRLPREFELNEHPQNHPDPHILIPSIKDTQKGGQLDLHEGHIGDNTELNKSGESFGISEDIPAQRLGKEISDSRKKTTKKPTEKDRFLRSQKYVFKHDGKLAKLSKDKVNMVGKTLYAIPGSKSLVQHTRNVGRWTADQEDVHFRNKANSWFEQLYKDMEINNRQLNPNLEEHLIDMAKNAVYKVYHEVTMTFFGALVSLYPHPTHGRHTSIRDGWKFVTNLLDPWRTVDWQDAYRSLSIQTDEFDINNISNLLSYLMKLQKNSSVSMKVIWKMTEKWRSEFSYHPSENIESLSDFCKKIHFVLKKDGAFPQTEIILLDSISSLKREIPHSSFQAFEETHLGKENSSNKDLTCQHNIKACITTLKKAGKNSLKHLGNVSDQMVEKVFQKMKVNVERNGLEWPMEFTKGFKLTLRRTKKSITLGFIGVLVSLHPVQELVDGINLVALDGLNFLTDFMKDWDSTGLSKALSMKVPNLESFAETHDPSILLGYLIRLKSKNATPVAMTAFWGLYKSWAAWTKLKLENKNSIHDFESFLSTIQEILLTQKSSELAQK